MQVLNAVVPDPATGSGAVTRLLLGELEDVWDAVGLGDYPSLGVFQGMIRSQKMRAIEHHRPAGQPNIRTRQQP